MFWKDSVRKNGNRIRVTAQLIYAQDGAHLWAERYDRIKRCISDKQYSVVVLLGRYGELPASSRTVSQSRGPYN